MFPVPVRHVCYLPQRNYLALELLGAYVGAETVAAVQWPKLLVKLSTPLVLARFKLPSLPENDYRS